MGYRDYEDKPCALCGKLFHGRYNAKYCGPECKAEGNRRNMRRLNAMKKLAVEEKKQKSQTLTEIAKLARAAGMQYGDYVAKHGL